MRLLRVRPGPWGRLQEHVTFGSSEGAERDYQHLQVWRDVEWGDDLSLVT